MARDVYCDAGCAERATWLIGNMQSGEQTALCDVHMIPWMVAQLDTVDDNELRMVVVTTLAAKLPDVVPPEEPEGAAPKRGGRRRRGGVVAVIGDGTGPAPDPTQEAGPPAVDAQPAQGVAEAPPAPADG